MPSLADIRKSSSSYFVITKPLSLDQLVSKAGIIFRGRVKSVDVEKWEGLEVRKITFYVTDPIKGLTGSQITLREWLLAKSPLTNPIMKTQEHVFFFHEPSSKGLTSLVGLEQGLVSVESSSSVRYAHKLDARGISKTEKIKIGARNKTVNLESYDGLKEYCKNYGK